MPLSELESIISKSGVVRKGTDPRQLGMSIIGMVLIFYLSRPLGNIFGVDDRDEAFFLERRKKSIIDLILNGVLVSKEKTESAYA